ncbi:MAG: ABC transporter substrate-binding protein [Gammaproteobacteria bacterium]|nr:ABC transporter substrate-binding protein [Gammaproteobacteria bacterium]
MSTSPKNLFILLIGLMVLGCTNPAEPPLRLGTNVWPGYEPLYLAREIGALANNRVKLIEYPSATEVIRAFRNGSLELASLTLDEVLLLLQDGIPVKVILVHDISNGADVILARQGINSMKQIRGKRVAVESGALGAYILARALELNHMSFGDVQIRHLDVNMHEAAFDRSEVDVVVNFEPVRTRLIKTGAREVFSSREIYGEVVDVLVVHDNVMARRGQDLEYLVKGWFTALNYFSRNPRDAAAVMSKRLGIGVEEIIGSYHGLTLPSTEENKSMLGGDKPALAATIKHLERILRTNRLLHAGIDTQDLFSGALLPDPVK